MLLRLFRGAVPRRLDSTLAGNSWSLTKPRHDLHILVRYKYQRHSQRTATCVSLVLLNAVPVVVRKGISLLVMESVIHVLDWC